MKKEDLYISQPLPASKLFHVFKKENNESLCGRVAIFARNDDYCEPVKGTEKYKKGQDCKSCFDKLQKELNEKRMDA